MSKIESPCQMPMVILIWFHLVQHNKLESAVPDEELQLHHETSVGGVVLFFHLSSAGGAGGLFTNISFMMRQPNDWRQPEKFCVQHHVCL